MLSFVYQPPRASQPSRRKRGSVVGGDRLALLLVWVAFVVAGVAGYAVLAPVSVETASSAPPTTTTSAHPTSESVAAPTASPPGSFDNEAAREVGGVIPVTIEPITSIRDGECPQPEGWLGPAITCEGRVD
ncbi:MAG: hypothetical protein JWP85_43 [Rhodoglobus sp.]|nr:hypothetical protein [Rhodoglobus sp.]